MTDVTHKKKDFVVYVALDVDAFLRDGDTDRGKEWTKTWIKTCVGRMLLVLAREVNKKIRENPNFLVSNMEFKLEKKD